MTRLVVFPVLMALALGSAGPVSARQSDETSYTPGALGATDISAGNLAGAERVLKSDEQAIVRDPARLLNLGYVYARTGRVAEARTLFGTVMRLPSEDLMLLDGRAITSRKAAKEALSALDLK